MNPEEITAIVEKNIRLELMVKALADSSSNYETLQKIASPYADGEGWIRGLTAEDSWNWEEEHLFNEARLYKALGKDDARTILGIWRRFRQICELLTLWKQAQG